MKTYQIQSTGGFDGLKLIDRPDPKPGAGQVLVGLRAASLNFRDLMVISGNYGRVKLPIVPLSDGAGEVLAVGEGVTAWKPGDRVAGTFFQNWIRGPLHPGVAESALGGSIDGVLAEQVVFSAEGLVRVPDHLDFAQAATLPCAALTAWNALVFSGRVTASDTVLVQGTGGVSLFALQFAKMHGARVFLTSGSEEKLARARELGADETINYRTTPDWGREVRERTGGAGVQHVVEVGGQDTFAKALTALAPGGTISVIGGLSGFTTQAPLIDIIGRNALIRGIYVGHREMFEAMNLAINRHRLVPVIDRRFAFGEAADAYRHLQSGAHFGKIVITL
jgi:NADPH:quinone reductase-like Zn-dependent oxidoreductase